MTSTGPIEVTGQIMVQNSTLSGGISDEDIIVWDNATISWDVDSIGTGGSTDNWVNILTTRTIGVQNSQIVAFISGIGYNAKTIPSGLSDNTSFDGTNGDHIIEIGDNENDRMVRWQDGNGVLHTENATIRLVLLTPWATHEYDFGELPRTNHVDLVMPLPYLELISLEESSSTGTANTRLGVMATVRNSGFDSASFQFECQTEGEDANIGLTVTTEIQAGETLEIPLNWDTATEGTKKLDCSIYTPTNYDGIDVGGGIVVSTGEVVWESWDESGSINLFLPILIGTIIGVGISIYIRMYPSTESDSEEKTYLADEVAEEENQD